MTSNLSPQETPLGYGALMARLFGLFPALALLMSVKGGFVGFTWSRPVKVRKAFEGLNYVKTVSCVGRVGLSHDNRQAVKEARADGTLPEVNQGLPWGEWLYAPYFITHKGALYVRLYPVENAIPHAVFTLNGKEIAKETLQGIALASEFSELDGAIGCMTLRAEHLMQVRYSEQVIDVETFAVSSVS